MENKIKDEKDFLMEVEKNYSDRFKVKCISKSEYRGRKSYVFGLYTPNGGIQVFQGDEYECKHYIETSYANWNRRLKKMEQ